MSDSGAEAAPAATPKRAKKAAKPKKPKSAPSHPKVSEMVTEAISSLKERGGSSLQAIKKHIGANHKVDVERLAPFIKKYLRTAVASGSLVQTKGKGASGSFRLSAPGPKDKNQGTKRTAAKKPKPAAKKATPTKRAAVKKPVKKAPAAKKAKSPKKAKATKPKAPKPKKAKPAAKKAAPKKTGRK